MDELYRTILSIGPPFNMIVLIVLICSVTGVIACALNQIRKYACHRQEIELKRDLVERGLAVDEIERIVQAKGDAIGGGPSDD